MDEEEALNSAESTTAGAAGNGSRGHAAPAPAAPATEPSQPPMPQQQQPGRPRGRHGGRARRHHSRDSPPPPVQELRQGMSLVTVVRNAVVVTPGAAGDTGEEAGEGSAALPPAPTSTSATPAGPMAPTNSSMAIFAAPSAAASRPSSASSTAANADTTPDYWSLPNALYDPNGYAPTRVTIVEEGPGHVHEGEPAAPAQAEAPAAAAAGAGGEGSQRGSRGLSISAVARSLSRVLSLSSSTTATNGAAHVGGGGRGPMVAAVPESIELVMDEGGGHEEEVGEGGPLHRQQQHHHHHHHGHHHGSHRRSHSQSSERGDEEVGTAGPPVAPLEVEMAGTGAGVGRQRSSSVTSAPYPTPAPISELERQASALSSNGSVTALPVARPLAYEPSSYTAGGGPPVIENATANQDAHHILSLSPDQIRLYAAWKTSKRLANGCFISMGLTAFWVLRFRAAFTLLLVPLMGWYGARGFSPLVIAAYMILQCVPTGIRVYALAGWGKHQGRDPGQEEGQGAADLTSPGAEHAVLALYCVSMALELILLYLAGRLFTQLRRCHPLEVRLLRTVYHHLFRQVERQTEGRCTC